MNKQVLLSLLCFVAIFALQVLLFNQICFMGVITPIVYMMFILTLPFNTPKWIVVVLSFSAGLLMDCFSGMLGPHALSLLFLGFSRSYILSFLPKRGEKEDHLRPIVYDMMFPQTLFYVFSLCLIYHFVFFFVDVMSFTHLGRILLLTLVNALCSCIMIILIEYLFYKPSKRY